MKTIKESIAQLFEAIRLLAIDINSTVVQGQSHEERIAKLEKFEALHLVDDMKKIVKEGE